MTTLDPDIIARVRALIPDTDAIYGAEGDEYLFDDDNISYFYDEGFNSVKYAAGLAKVTVGSSEALILKVISNYETKTDGASLAKQWLAMGKELMDRAAAELGLGAVDYFDVVPYCDDEIHMEGMTGGYPHYNIGIPVRSRGYYPWGGYPWG